MSSDNSYRVNYSEGLSQFQSARRRAFWQDMLNHLRGKSPDLLSFDDIKTRLRLREESYRGLQDVPLDRIVGSVGRYRDFTANFLPKTNDMQERWSRVYAHVSSMEGVPPVELYKIDDVYFVRDGNHRVSVARQMGAKTIHAHVTELPTAVDLEPGMSQEELDAAESYAAFLEESGLTRKRIHHQSLMLSEPSRYAELLGHIYLHQRFLEHERGQPVPLDEAAADWYDNVYRPAVTLIRKYDILEQSQERTEADLYLWLVDHLREVRLMFGEEAPTRSFSDALVDYLTERGKDVPEELLIEEDDSVIVSKTQIMRAVEAKKQEEEETAP
jgi:hypothetical protein